MIPFYFAGVGVVFLATTYLLLFGSSSGYIIGNNNFHSNCIPTCVQISQNRASDINRRCCQLRHFRFLMVARRQNPEVIHIQLINPGIQSKEVVTNCWLSSLLGVRCVMVIQQSGVLHEVATICRLLFPAQNKILHLAWFRGNPFEENQWIMLQLV